MYFLFGKRGLEREMRVLYCLRGGRKGEKYNMFIWLFIYVLLFKNMNIKVYLICILWVCYDIFE